MCVYVSVCNVYVRGSVCRCMRANICVETPVAACVCSLQWLYVYLVVSVCMCAVTVGVSVLGNGCECVFVYVCLCVEVSVNVCVRACVRLLAWRFQLMREYVRA